MGLLSDLNTIGRGEKAEFICQCCQKIFLVNKSFARKVAKGTRQRRFCSKECSTKIVHGTRHVVECKQCKGQCSKKQCQIKTTKNSFCSYQCARIYQNSHKTTGFRRSKLEFWLENKLTFLYPNLKVLYNYRTEIKAELDIYIPSLNLAFELNGIFHYEPIYGTEQLNKVQNNDNRKFQACLEKGIELCIIDTSQQKYFKESTSIKYLEIIIQIIKKKMSAPTST